MGNFQIENGCLKKYTGTDAEAVVPDGITRIGETAFDECRNLVNVCLPEPVVKVRLPDFQSAVSACRWF